LGFPAVWQISVLTRCAEISVLSRNLRRGLLSKVNRAVATGYGTRAVWSGHYLRRKTDVRISNRLWHWLPAQVAVFEIPLGRIQSFIPFLCSHLSIILADRRTRDVGATICRKVSLAQDELGPRAQGSVTELGLRSAA